MSQILFRFPEKKREEILRNGNEIHEFTNMRNRDFIYY